MRNSASTEVKTIVYKKRLQLVKGVLEDQTSQKRKDRFKNAGKTMVTSQSIKDEET